MSFVDDPVQELNRLRRSEIRYRNALLWIRTIAGMHYFGGAFDPEHMRALANLAAEALDLRTGRDIPDFEARMAAAKQRARETAAALGFELIAEEEEEPTP